MDESKKEKRKLTQERVKELFNLDPSTGILTRRVRTARRTKIGEQVGVLDRKGYLNTEIGGIGYRVHRIIFLYVHGYFPEHQIDHINRIRTDNRPCNLREVSPQCNTRNSCVYSSNSSGVKGVYFHTPTNKWQARISVNGRAKSLGLYTDFVEAVCYRFAVEQCLRWGDCDSNTSSYQYLKERGILK